MRYTVTLVRPYGVYTGATHEGQHAERSAMLAAESKALSEKDVGHVVVLAVSDVGSSVAIHSIAQFECGSGYRTY